MERFEFLGTNGDFVLHDADKDPGTYFPLVNAAGMMSSITPTLAGDCKTGQNTYLLAPASAETLHESRATRNFWLGFEDGTLWSTTGQSAAQRCATGEKSTVYGGLLWHKLLRESPARGVSAEITSLVPATADTVELMRVTVRNTGSAPLCVTPTAAIPLYGRSADNIRDHRHVTSLLQRLCVAEDGVTLTPTLTFDERGHKPGHTVYTVRGREENGAAPVRFLGTVQDFAGAGGYDWPDALRGSAAWLKAGDTAAGYEMAAVLQFAPRTIAPGTGYSWFLALGIDADASAYLAPDAFSKALEDTRRYWQDVGAAKFTSGNVARDAWMRWVAIQPMLRRICGCSFLPHHDYGRGGRGWRDLWQDSLALILSDPAATRQDLVRYFAGVRADGTNATIIGSAPGEFLADRNNIVRVWMDHGFWPLLTMDLYIQQSGDLDVLLEQQPWFCDNRKHRGELLAENPAVHTLQLDGETVKSSVLEHLIAQNVTACFDAGVHGNIRLRGADWNDALDMAADGGESVAFTAAYAGNLHTLARLCRDLGAAGHPEVTIGAALADLLLTKAGTPDQRNAARQAYEAVCEQRPGGTTQMLAADAADALDALGAALADHLRANELVTDGGSQCWMNSYYDNNGCRVEGVHGSTVRMMLTGQVFALLSGTANEDQVDAISRAADWYLDSPLRGGYCLNTDFGSEIPPLGRQFGFAYGHKENGAVFCHMAVMYAAALYSRRRADAGWHVLRELLDQSMNFDASRIYPGIPEYFDPRGRGMYPYLTGAGSWLMLCMLNNCYGVRGQNGDLLLDPQLVPDQFDTNGTAAVTCRFAEREWEIHFHNPARYAASEFRVAETRLDAHTYGNVIPRSALLAAKDDRIDVILCAR